MSPEEVRSTVVEVIRDVLDLDESVQISDQTKAQDVKGWDSLKHVRIMLSIEKKFKVRLTDQEIMALKNVGDIFQTLSQKLDAVV